MQNNMLHAILVNLALLRVTIYLDMIVYQLIQYSEQRFLYVIVISMIFVLLGGAHGIFRLERIATYFLRCSFLR
jgi:hypothetical protein